MDIAYNSSTGPFGPSRHDRIFSAWGLSSLLATASRSADEWRVTQVRRDSAPTVRSSSTVSAANIPGFPVGTGNRGASVAAAQPGGEPPGRTPAIELRDITFGYNGATSVVEHVDL